MAEATNPSIFNVGSLYRLASESRGETMLFGAYNGAMTITVFYTNSKKNSKIRVSYDYYSYLLSNLTEVSKGVPGAAFSIKSMSWNPQIKKRELSNVFTIGRDSNNLYYIEFKDADSAPIKFPFLGNKNIEGNGESDSERSAIAFRGFNTFVKLVWPCSLLMTTNNLYRPGTTRSSSKSSSGSSEGGNYSGSEDDIY